MCFFVQTNHTRKELLFLMFKEINLRNHSSLHKLFYSLNEKYHLYKKESTSPIYIYYINDNGRLLISKQKISLPPTITNIELSKEMIAYCEQFIFKNLKGLTKISEDQALTINVLDYLHNSEVIKISDCLSKNFP